MKKLIALIPLLAVLGTPAFADAPQVRIGKTQTPPQLDGRLTDAVWDNSITLSDFTVTGSKRPAAEPTTVKFLHDANNLYIGWNCRESLLTVAQQRMHEVRANITRRDGDVLSDDNFIIFLRPSGGDAVYEFNINSIGTLFDAQSTRNDLWKARNESWNAQAKAAAVQEDGFWTGELAVPWQAFGRTAPPRPGTQWEIGLARRAVGRNESSAWHQSESSALHIIDQWGQLVFDENVPGISPQPLPDFDAGKSNLAVRLTNATENITVEASVNENNKITRFQQSAVAGPQSTVAVPVTATGDTLLWQWAAKGQSGTVFYRSPQLLLSARSSQARLKISTQAGWKLFVNQTKVDEDTSATEREVTFALEQGINDIVVETQSGTARLELHPPALGGSQSIVWRTAPVTADKTLARKGAIAAQNKGVIGTAGTPALLQHSLLLNGTPHYPKTDPALHIAQGATQHLTFIAEGVEGLRFEDWSASIAVPQEIEVLGSSGFYGKFIANKPEFRTTPAGETTINGQRLRLYRIEASKPLIYKKNQAVPLITFEVLLRLSQGIIHDSAREWPLYYWTAGNKNSVSEVPHSVSIRTAPALQGKQPKKLVWEFWTSGTHVYDDRELLRNILDTSRQAGFNKYLASSWKDLNDMIREYGMKTFALVMFKDGRTFDLVRPHLIAHPDERMIDKTGKPMADYMCTTKLHGENWPMFAKSIQEWMLKADLDAVEYDYEYPPFNPPHACFCNRCLIEFRRHAKIADAIELTSESVQKDYSTQWIDFMAYRTAVLLGKMKQAVHEANPNVKFTSYSGYYDAKNDTTKSRYGIDWNLVGQMQAIDEAGMGYGRPAPGVTDSIAALRGIPVKYGELLVPYDVRSERTVVPLKKANLLRRALDATGGVLVYERRAMDGRSWFAVGETTRLVADFEDLFIEHRPESLAGQNPDHIQLLRGEQQSLVCVMNLTAKPATYSFALPQELGGGHEYYSSKTVRAGETINLTLEPGETAVYILKVN